LRIIAGQAKGRKLNSLKGRKTRPTSDRVKEALFSMLSSIVVNKEILDLFAGTGNLGLEALSRGAFKATFVDKDKSALNLLKSNIKLLEFEERAEIYLADAFKALKMFGKAKKKFDIVFIDPPYGENLYERIIISLLCDKVLNKESIVVIEHLSQLHLREKYNGLSIAKSRRYGNTCITIYTKEDTNENSGLSR